MSRKFLFLPLLAAILGCQSYRPLPIDWTREHAVWLEKGALTFDTLEDVARLALVGNPELNALRPKRSPPRRAGGRTPRSAAISCASSIRRRIRISAVWRCR